jgi:uncharacterized membrane protein
VDAVATWFARIGAVALLLAAAYGYKYAVDRGLITPAFRVALGLMAGSGLLVAGEATRRRDWSAFAQAVTGGGIGLLYLSTWAAYSRYGLISAPAAFAALAVVVALGVGFAWRHESEALAILATIGGFLNPYLVGNAMQPVPVLGYIALLDAGILATVTLRPWRAVGRVAFAGTWLFAALSADAAGPGAAMAYATVFWAMFSAHPVLRSAMPGRRTHTEEAGFAVANAFAFWFFGMAVLMVHADALRGAFTAALGGAYLVQWAAVNERARTEAERLLANTLAALAIGFFTLAIPMQFEGHVITAGWTVEAVVLIALGRQASSRALWFTGLTLLAGAVTGSVIVVFGLGALYDPVRPLFSAESFTLLLQVGALHAAAALSRPKPGERPDEAEQAIPAIASVAGHGLALIWAAFETVAYWQAHRTGLAAESAVQFTLTVTWSLYGAGLMAAGIMTRRRRARLLALGLLVATIAKVAVIDLWLLSTLERVFAFGALGVILLVCSLMYHRFRELILVSDGR